MAGYRHGRVVPGGAGATTRGTVRRVSDVLLATEADWLFDDIDAALGGAHTVSRIRDGSKIVDACRQVRPQLVLLDLQIGNMGGMAASMLLAQEIRAGRAEPTAIMLLLDREHDAWLASQADADGWMVKPLDSLRLRRATDTILAGGVVQEGPVDEAAPAPEATDIEAQQAEA